MSLTIVSHSYTTRSGYSPRPMVSLIIGIDNYTHIRQLKGAVADAHSMHDYLVKRLGVPPNSIDMLINEQATRAAIIHSIKDISRRLAAQTGLAPAANAILIYFAGHGTMAKAPKNWRGEREGAPIPMICPSDVFAPASDSEGRVVQPIPGNTIAGLLRSLSKEGYRGNEYIVSIASELRIILQVYNVFLSPSCPSDCHPRLLPFQLRCSWGYEYRRH